MSIIVDQVLFLFYFHLHSLFLPRIMKTIVLRPFYYRQREQIRLDFDTDVEISHILRNTKGIIWSNKKECWYMPFSSKIPSFLSGSLSDKAAFDSHYIDEYIQKRKRYTRKFDWVAFLIALTVFCGLAALGFIFYGERDSGTIGNNFFKNFFADCYAISRFPLITFFWGRHGGIKTWEEVVSYLFLNSIMYSIITERIYSFLSPKKKLIQSKILAGELNME